MDELLEQAKQLPLAKLADPDNDIAKRLSDTQWIVLCGYFFQFIPQITQPNTKALFLQACHSLAFNNNIQSNAEQIYLRDEPNPYPYVLNELYQLNLESSNYTLALDYAERYARIYYSPGHLALVTVYHALYLALQEDEPNITDKLRTIVMSEASPYHSLLDYNPSAIKLILDRFLLTKTRIHLRLAEKLQPYSIPAITQPITEKGCKALLGTFNVVLQQMDEDYINQEINRLFSATGIEEGITSRVDFQFS